MIHRFEITEIFPENLWGKNIFIAIYKTRLAFSLCWLCALMVQSRVNSLSQAVAQIIQVHLVFLTTRHHTHNNKNLKNIPNETVNT